MVLLTDGVGLSPQPVNEAANETEEDADSDANVENETDTPPRTGIEIVRIGVPAVPGNLGLTAADLVATGDQNPHPLLRRHLQLQ